MVDMRVRARTGFHAWGYESLHGYPLRDGSVLEVKCLAPWRCSAPHRIRQKWAIDGHNLVVTAGLNILLDSTIKTGVTTPLWYVLLKGTGTAVAGDTMGSHVGWADIVPYSNATRPAFTPGTITGGAVDNSAAKAVFNIDANSTLYGAGLTNSATKSGTSGTLYGAGDFSGSQAVIIGDTVNVQLNLAVTG